MRRPSRRRSSACSSTAKARARSIRFDGRREPLAYLDYLTSALPYHLLRAPRVLVLGAGAGADVLQAICPDARAIDAVELDPLVVELVRAPLRAISRAASTARRACTCTSPRRAASSRAAASATT